MNVKEITFTDENLNIMEKKLRKDVGKETDEIMKDFKRTLRETDVITLFNIREKMKKSRLEFFDKEKSRRCYLENYKWFFETKNRRYEGKWVVIKNKRVILDANTQNSLINKLIKRNINDLQEVFISFFHKKDKI